jgi:hypothetical protein
MGRYFFDLLVDGDITRDDEGVELGSPEDAGREAAVILAEVARDYAKSEGLTTLALSVAVRDERHAILKSELTVDSTSLN